MHHLKIGFRTIIFMIIVMTTTMIGAFADYGDIVLKQGMTHEYVADTKYMLGLVGYVKVETGYATPIFDVKLTKSVKNFQLDYQLKSDGIIGAETAKYIMTAVKSKNLIINDLGATLLKKGMTHKEIATIKRIFVFVGDMPAATPITEYYDDAFFIATQKFQKEYALKVDGIIGQDTAKVLAAAVKQKEIITNGGVPKDINVADLLSRGGNSRGNTIIETGKRLLGVRYSWGGTTPKGVDCSGFTTWTFKQLGKTLPRSASGQYGIGTTVKRADLQEGDLVFFTTSRTKVGHVGIYMGNDQFIHSSTSKRKVVIESFSGYCEYSKFLGAKRVSY